MMVSPIEKEIAASFGVSEHEYTRLKIQKALREGRSIADLSELTPEDRFIMRRAELSEANFAQLRLETLAKEVIQGI